MMRLVKMLMRKYVKPVLLVPMILILPWQMSLAQGQGGMD